MKKLLYLLLIILLVPTSLHSQYFKNLNMEDGLTWPSVMCIYQDTLGRMWFGTREGVNIYDGKEIKNFRPLEIEEKEDLYFIASNEIKNLKGDKDGDVYIHVGRALYRFDIHREKLHKIYPMNEVTGICSSLNKDIWYATYDSLYYYDSKKDETTIRKRLGIKRLSSMIQTDSSTLYIGTENGLYKLTLSTGKLTSLIPDIDVRDLYFSSKHELWIGSRRNGLYTIKRDGTIKHAPISPHHVVSNQVRQIIEDEDKNIWFGTFDGLQKYDPYKEEYTVYRADNCIGSLSHSSVFSLYRDKQGTIWVGTYYGGVNYFYQQQYIYKNYTYDNLRDNCLNFPFVGEMIEDKDRNIWIGTDGGGVNCLNRKTQKFTYYVAGKNGLLHNNIKAITYDKAREQIYVGTHTGGLSRIDRITGKVYNFLEEKNYQGPDDIIYHVDFYQDHLYVSALNGFWRYSPRTGKFDLLDNSHHYVNFEIDNKGYVWLNSKWNIMLINLNQPNDIKIFRAKNNMRIKGIITHIMQSSSDLIYISTSGYGIYCYHPDTGILEQMTREKDKLISNYCYNVIETSNGNILITTDKGISLYSPMTCDVYSFDGYENRDMSAITDECGLFVASDGLIYVGGINGMFSFDEKDVLYDNRIIPNSDLYFSHLKVNNTDITPGDESQILEKSLPFTEKLTLSHRQNNFTITYSSSNYITFLRNNWYQYRLEGFDKDWILTTNTSVNYTNLPPGNYTLHVIERGNMVNFLEGKEISIPITVLTPWFRTWLAYLVYLIILCIIIYTIWHIIISKKLYDISLANEKKEKERIEELNKMKLRFFTNISHELRTPLTLIAGQVEMLIQDRTLPLTVRRKINRIYQNTVHMRNLISELLDFRKQDQGFLKLKVQQYDIVEFVNNIFSTFKDYAQRRNIRYVYEGPGNGPIKMWFDALQLQKAIFNLLSNAFKYTKEKGNIILRLKQIEEGVEIEVEDTGKGISDIDIKNIFDRFYLAGDVDSPVTSRTGIGLALTKGIVELHHGKINVESEVGKGSIFTIRLLSGNTHFTEEELSTKTIQADPKSVLEEKFYEAQLEMDTRNEKFATIAPVAAPDDTNESKEAKPSMLIVEDDNDIIDMLEEIFSSIYIIFKAHNGKEGLEMANELQPNIIVSDVMMPIMSGKEMCIKIKDSIETSHIPVVLLTAQTAEEQTLEGYSLGADDYVTKPFNIKLLVARCNNLVNNRRILMNKLKDTSNNQQELVNTTMALNAMDQKLIDQATQIIKENFDNSDFNMDMLAIELNMGRSKLYTRFKEITGLTPNEFTLRLKLEEAKMMLINSPDMNISDISYRLGFSSLRYFSKCFKSICGLTPLEFRKNSNAS